MPGIHCILASLYLLLCVGAQAARADDAAYEREPINYPTAPTRDAITRLRADLDSGKLKLDYDEKLGYLPALLKALKIPASSQTLVFSKTSLQRDRISPQRPRALYFNDDVYVGFVQGSEIMEVTATDPVSGPIFYTVRDKRVGGPAIVRQNDACLQCHASSMTGDIPGHLARSVYPDSEGQPILSAGTFRINPSSPLKQRWGGWYVTGLSGDQRHMGNVITPDRDSADKTDFSAGANLTDLSGKLDTSPYLRPTSDIVALMVLEHQTYVHNQITRANFLTRLATHDAVEMNKALSRPVDFQSDSTVSRIKNAVEPLVKAILFSEEAPLTDEIRGTSGFTADFAAAARRDAKGRSLRDFDLKARMFKYPCSYLIYGESMDALPAEAKAQFYARLFEVLSGRDQSKEFTHLSPADRKAITEILKATKKDLPAQFNALP